MLKLRLPNLLSASADTEESPDSPAEPQIAPLRPLDSQAWTSRLGGLVSRVDQIVESQDAGTGVMAILGQIARVFGGAWAEAIGETDIAETHAAVLADVRSASADSIVGTYSETVNTARQQLESSIKAAVAQRDEEENRRSGTLRRALEAAVKSLNRVKATMVGDEKISIKITVWWLAWATAAVLMAIFLGAEALAGFDIFRFGMSPGAAYAISFLTAFIQSTLTEFGGNYAGIIASHLTARKRFAIRFPNTKKMQDGTTVRLDDDGQPITLNPLSHKVIIAGIGCSIGCWLFALGLVVWRIKQSTSSSLLGDSSVTAAAVMSIATIVFWFVRLVFSPNFDPEDTDSYLHAVSTEAAARKEFDNCGKTAVTVEDQNGDPATEHIDTFSLARATAIETFREAVQGARQEALAVPQTLRTRIQQLVAACGTVSAAISTSHHHFEDAVNAALKLMDESVRTGFNATDAATLTAINRLHSNAVAHPVPAAEIDELRKFNIVITLPEAPNPEAEAEKIEAAIRPRKQAPVVPAPHVRLTATGESHA